MQELRDHARQYVQATPELPAPTAGLVRSLEDPGQLADLMAASLPLTMTSSSRCNWMSYTRANLHRWQIWSECGDGRMP